MWKTEVFGARPFRLALAFALAIAAATIGAFGLIYLEVSRENADRVGEILAEEMRLNYDASEDRLRAALAARQTQEIRRLDYLALYDDKGRLLLGNVPRLPPIKVDGRPHLVSADTMASYSAPNEPAILVARQRTDGRVALIGRNLQDTEEIENSLLRALGIALAPTIVAILAIGAFFARRALRRLDSVRGAIVRIMEGDLHSRVSRDRDEVDRVAEAVNLMLDEIARLLDQLKSVGDNIAHDLRAPLTVAKVKLERALETEETAPVRVQVEAALAQLDRAAVAISALLRISAVENGPRHKQFRDVDLAAVCMQAAEFYEPLAEAKSIALTCSAPTPLWIRGDEDLLREAVSNLVENAVKFTPASGAVWIAAYSVDGRPRLEVRDTGPGVPPADREAIFLRFYRAAAGEAGNGLGLNIARTIAELHGFDLKVEDNSPGARFIMRAAAKATLARVAIEKSGPAPLKRILR